MRRLIIIGAWVFNILLLIAGAQLLVHPPANPSPDYFFFFLGTIATLAILPRS